MFHIIEKSAGFFNCTKFRSFPFIAFRDGVSFFPKLQIQKMYREMHNYGLSNCYVSEKKSQITDQFLHYLPIYHDVSLSVMLRVRVI